MAGTATHRNRSGLVGLFALADGAPPGCDAATVAAYRGIGLYEPSHVATALVSPAGDRGGCHPGRGGAAGIPGGAAGGAPGGGKAAGRAAGPAGDAGAGAGASLFAVPGGRAPAGLWGRPGNAPCGGFAPLTPSGGGPPPPAGGRGGGGGGGGGAGGGG